MEAKERGNRAFQSGDWRAAAHWYTAAVQEDPGLVAAYANRAACEIQLHDWTAGLRDCDTALAMNAAPSLRIKILWRKAVCLRHLGQDQSEWAKTVQEGLAMDAANDKLLGEQQRLFVRRTESTPPEYTQHARMSSRPTPASGTALGPSSAPTTRFAQFTPPSRPLTYAGVLKLVRSKSEAAYEFWYTQVPAQELVDAHRTAGIEPDTLDYLHEMIALHPQYRDKNQEIMRSLPQCTRYSSASLLADENLYTKALAVSFSK